MPAATRTRKAGGTPAASPVILQAGGAVGGQTATAKTVTVQPAVGRVGGGVTGAVTPKPKLAEAVRKKLQAATQVVNVSVSEGIQIHGASEEEKAIPLARAVMVHYGFGENEEDLRAASELFGLALWELWREKTHGRIAKANWEMVSDLCRLVIVQISSAKEVRYPAEAVARVENAMFVAKGADDYIFVTLHPSRRPTGSAEEFVSKTLQQWTDERRGRSEKVVVLTGSDDDGMPVMAKRKKDAGDEGDRTTKRGGGFEIDGENDFVVTEAHPILDAVGQFDPFKGQMRSVVAKKPIGWSAFVGDDIRASFDMTYKMLYGQEFEEAKMTKSEFLRRAEEVCDFERKTVSAKDKGEPRLYEDPEGVPEFTKEYRAYLKRDCGHLTGTEKCERLLRAIDERHREWTINIRTNCSILQGEALAERRLVMIFQRLETLAESELATKKANYNMDKTGVRQLERAFDQGHHQDRGYSGRKGQHFDRRGGGQEQITNQSYQPIWQGGRNTSYQGTQPQQGYFQNPFAGNVTQHQAYSGGPMAYPVGNMAYPVSGGMTYPMTNMPYPVSGMPGPANGMMEQQQLQGARAIHPHQGGGAQNPMGNLQQVGVPGEPYGSQPAPGLPRRNTYRGQQQTPARQPTDLSQITCYNCGAMGHYASQCAGPRLCRNCGSAEHMSMNCDGSGPKLKPIALKTEGERPGTNGTTMATQQQYVPTQLGKTVSSRVSFSTSNQPRTAQPNQQPI
jgi:hypothetical protein